jgi:hypothetical protein
LPPRSLPGDPPGVSSKQTRNAAQSIRVKSRQSRRVWRGNWHVASIRICMWFELRAEQSQMYR